MAVRDARRGFLDALGVSAVVVARGPRCVEEAKQVDHAADDIDPKTTSVEEVERVITGLDA